MILLNATICHENRAAMQAAVYDMLLVAITLYLALRSEFLLPRDRLT